MRNQPCFTFQYKMNTVYSECIQQIRDTDKHTKKTRKFMHISAQYTGGQAITYKMLLGQLCNDSLLYQEVVFNSRLNESTLQIFNVGH